jgi:hypothetical protein
VVAVAVDDGPPRELRRLVALALEELGQEERLRGEPRRREVVGEEVDELVPEDGDAARL